jgi:hypothetical protein
MALTPEQLEKLRRSRPTTGNRVDTAIKLVGLTKMDVARQTGLPYTYVTDVTYGRYESTTVDKAHVFAAFFGCAIEDLFPAKKVA